MKILNIANIPPKNTHNLINFKQSQPEVTQPTISKSTELTQTQKESFKTRIRELIAESKDIQDWAKSYLTEAKYKQQDAQYWLQTTKEDIQNLIDKNILAASDTYFSSQIVEDGRYVQKYNGKINNTAQYFIDDEGYVHIKSIDIYQNGSVDKLIFDLDEKLTQYHVGFNGNIDRKYDSIEVYRFKNGNLISCTSDEKLLNPTKSICYEKYYFSDDKVSEYSRNRGKIFNNGCCPFSETYKFLFDKLTSYSNSDEEKVYINQNEIEYRIRPQRTNKDISVKFDKKEI